MCFGACAFSMHKTMDSILSAKLEKEKVSKGGSSMKINEDAIIHQFLCLILCLPSDFLLNPVLVTC